jgi:hypothetical protein
MQNLFESSNYLHLKFNTPNTQIIIKLCLFYLASLNIFEMDLSI